ncbi:MAG TPA: hypothetical protein ENH87_12795 [Pricia antarctica]|uniref:Uncharacterized protein n=1 Tax=Pricia antarctica TaxID=641691 RepID=A0A831QRK6_9FLAO|nr:hypothetical protein [Pricia antarctica]
MKTAVSKNVYSLFLLLFGVIWLWSANGYQEYASVAGHFQNPSAEISFVGTPHNHKSLSSLPDTKLDLRAENVEEEVKKIGFKNIERSHVLALLYALSIPQYLTLTVKGISFVTHFSHLQSRNPLYLRFGVLLI